MTFRIIFSITCCILATGCASLKPATFKNSKAKLDPVAFFGGNTSSYGVIESRTGKPAVGMASKTLMRDDASPVSSPIKYGDAADTRIIQDQTHDSVRKIVDMLPDEQREVTTVRYLQKIGSEICHVHGDENRQRHHGQDAG